jgi:tetratricopeptide (TPR) repeat protein/CHAT domain-containing protein
MRSFYLLMMILVFLLTGRGWAQEQNPGWLGIDQQSVSKEEAERLGWVKPRGAKVIRPLEGSPAAAAGLEPGDIIVALDGIEIDSGTGLTAAVMAKGAGSRVELRLMRAGREHVVPVMLGVLSEAEVLHKQAEQLFSTGKYAEAMPIAQRALVLGEQSFGPKDVRLAFLLYGLALIHDVEGRNAEAEAFYQRCLSVLENARGPGHASVGRILGNLGRVRTNLGRHDEAEALFTRSVAVLEKALGADHVDVAKAIANLAFSKLRAKRYVEAEALYQRALAIEEKAHEPDNVSISNTLADFAQLYKVQNLPAKAEPLYQRSLAMMEKARGPEHLDLLGPLDRLAEFYLKQSRYDEVEPLRKRALGISEKSLGRDDSKVRPWLEKLASAYIVRDRHADAEPLLRRSLAIMEKALGPDHPDLVGALHDLASIYNWPLRRYGEAEQLYQRALAIMEKARGPEHPDVRRPLNRLAAFYELRQRFAEAEPLRKRGLAIVEKALGEDHPDFKDQLYHVIHFYTQQHRYTEAEQLYLRMLAIAERSGGPDHPDVRAPLDSLASLYDTFTHRYDMAEPLRKRSLAIMEKTLGADHPDLKEPLQHLAELYGRQRRYTDAEPFLKRWIAIMERAAGLDQQDPADFLKPLERLAENYEAQNRHVEAEALYQHGLTIVEKARGSEHPDIRRPLDMLVQFYERRRYAKGEEQRSLEKMEPLRKRSLAITEKALGPNNLALGKELGNLADLYEKQKRFAEAEPLYRRWLAIVESVRGADHPEMLPPFDGLASLYELQKRYAEAEPLRERALAIIKAARGPGHRDVQRPLDNLASLYVKLGRHGQAEALRKEWLADVESVRGPGDPDVQNPLRELAYFYQSQHRYAEAEPLLRRALAIMEKVEGPDDPSLKTSLSTLASLYKHLGRYAEAEPLYKRMLAFAEKETGGVDGPGVRLVLRDLLEVSKAQAHHAEAETLARRLIGIAEREHTIDQRATGLMDVLEAHAELAEVLQGANRIFEAEEIFRRNLADAEKTDFLVSGAALKLAHFLRETYRLAEAETLYRRVMALNEPIGLGDGLHAFNALGMLLTDTNRLAEAEALYRRIRLSTDDGAGNEAGIIGSLLGNYARVLERLGRTEEAEALYRRDLAISEKINGPVHPHVATVLNNLAAFLSNTKRVTEAEALYRRALAIRERINGPDDAKVGTALNNLALLLESTNRVAEAEAMLRRAIAIEERFFGPDHPKLATALSNLALLTYRAGQLDEAESLMRRALLINQNTYGPNHQSVANDLAHLAVLRARHDDWVQAAALLARVKPTVLGRSGNGEGGDSTEVAKVMLRQHSGLLRFYADALHRAEPRSAAGRAEGFEVVQWALQTDAAEALAQMSARISKSDQPMANLVREREGLLARRRSEDKRMLEAVGANDTQALKGLYASKEEVNERLKRIDAELATKFPEYSDLANPKPVSFAETQALIRVDEALILFAEGPPLGKFELPQEMLAWVVTKDKVAWHRIALDSRALADTVMALRCGLDATLWDGVESSVKCQAVLKGTGYEDFDPNASSLLPFDLNLAHAFYKTLFGPAQGLIKDKHLLVVPSGPLTSLPLAVLVTEPQKLTGPAALADYRRAHWFGTRQPITVLPSVASLAALRRHARPSEALNPYVGFGDPALAGHSGCSTAAIPDRCPDEGLQVARNQSVLTRGAQRAGAITSYFRGGLADVAALREACPLPDTAYELRCVARSLGATPSALVLGEHMTEAAVKSARLDRYRVVHFATHGLLAGETAQLAKTRAEPALMMSPPAVASEEDDGLLTASEIAGLKLDADWVILSACNTAAGQEPGAEALSGLARAFFYAGARALLVSHWYVNSEAATLLTSRTFAEMRSSVRIGRAEAFRRAMLAVMTDDRRPWNAHPSKWAPFVVVGEGANLQAARVPPRVLKAPAAHTVRGEDNWRNLPSGSQ